MANEGSGNTETLTPSQRFERAYNSAQGKYPAIPDAPVSKRTLKPRPKNQKELSAELVEPYELAEYGNPNVVENPNQRETGIDFNRSKKLSRRNDKNKSYKISVQDIDEAVFYYLNEEVKPFVYQNGGRLPVPVIYGAPERWKSQQKDGFYRDKGGKIMLPIIVLQRTNLEKDRSVTAKVDSNSPHLHYSLDKGYNQKNSYSNFDVLNNRRPVKQSQAIVVGDFVTITYQCSIQTYYMEQLNGLIEAIEYASDSYWGDPERHKFRCFVDNLSSTTELTQGQERLVKSDFNIRLRGQIIPEVMQKDLNSINSINSVSKVTITQETVISIDDLN